MGPQLAEGVTVGEAVDERQTGAAFADIGPIIGVHSVDNHLLYCLGGLSFTLYPQAESLNLRFRPQAVDNYGDNFLELNGHDFTGRT